MDALLLDVSVRAVRTFEMGAVYFAMQCIIPATEVKYQKRQDYKLDSLLQPRYL